MEKHKTVAPADKLVPQFEIAPDSAKNLDMGQQGRDSHIIGYFTRFLMSYFDASSTGAEKTGKERREKPSRERDCPGLLSFPAPLIFYRASW
jgi:hypothetical protein